MVEQRGNAPRAAILQGSPAPLCLPLGARTWFRATLSCASSRRFHQISFPSHSVFRRKPAPDLIRGGFRFAVETRQPKSGADAGNRNRTFGVALRNSTFELRPRV